MCAKCIAIDKRLERLRYLQGRLTDPQTLDAIVGLTAELEAQKKALHPEE
jgi:hypothetical protein